eukprot:12490365-Alexandrium_andersonii.AAC.1
MERRGHRRYHRPCAPRERAIRLGWRGRPARSPSAARRRSGRQDGGDGGHGGRRPSGDSALPSSAGHASCRCGPLVAAG